MEAVPTQPGSRLSVVPLLCCPLASYATPLGGAAAVPVSVARRRPVRAGLAPPANAIGRQLATVEEPAAGKRLFLCTTPCIKESQPSLREIVLSVPRKYC